MKRLVIPVLLATLVACTATAAFADNISLGVANFGGYTGPYVNVNITLTSATTADVTFTSLAQGGYSFYMVDGGSTGLNVNSSAFTVSNWACTSLGGSFQTCSLANANTFGSGNEDGFGFFNLSIDMFDSFDHATNKVTFTITSTGSNWLTAKDVLTANNGGNVAAAHVAVCATATCSPSTLANVTGYVSNTAPTPEPASLSLLVAGLVGLGGMLRTRRRRA